MYNAPYRDRTDSVADKLRLLQAAYQAGNLDLAMSLSESAKDTIAFERQQRAGAMSPVVAADRFTVVNDLPRPWANWARGWSICKIITLFETVGIERTGEPVDLAFAFQEDQATDLTRELRVARIESGANTLVEIPCQVYGESRKAKERRCQVVFLADVSAHQQATYLVFVGNPLAERPEYRSDLRTTGEGYGLDIENTHFKAQLSRQMGQLERLIYKRQHSLELYAGGKGHGEPPGIDWAHDYVDVDHFQKLRMRNWPRCPNFEVVRGPLCTRVRRWGFPYSPVHPVFTPSRVHMDQTYVFFAGLPYFFKYGEIDVVKDVSVAAMRDDEWVFSGYSFTDTLWFDRQGKLHEGAVPPESARNLWGVGFYHRTSRDAFIAMWLEHEAKGFDRMAHGGVPTLHYDGHGQLWSRYPVDGDTTLQAGTSIRQKNAYLVSPYEGTDTAAKVERLRHQLQNPLEARPGEAPRMSVASGKRPLARFGETGDTAPLKPAIWKALREVRDEQLYKIDANVVDMGYVYDVRENNGVVTVLVTMPHRGRGVFEFLVTAGGGRVEPGIRERLLKLKGVSDVVVDLTWEPAWTVDRLSDAGRRALGLPD
jgi:metal-sulfur cluster biosynthetic enzyme